MWNIQMDIIWCMHLTINLIEITENIKFWCLQFLMQTIKLKHHEIGNVLFSAMHRSSFIKMALVFCLTLHYWPAVHKRMRLQSLNDIVCAWKNKLKQKIRETGTLWKLGQDFYDLSQIVSGVIEFWVLVLACFRWSDQQLTIKGDAMCRT